jgi:hypothetical protein
MGRSLSVTCLVFLLWVVPGATAAASASAAPACAGGGSGQAILSLSSGGSSGCDVTSGYPSPYIMEVQVLAGITPATSIHFSLQDPPFGTVISEAYAVPHAGDRTTGVDVDLGDCSSAGNYLLLTLAIELPTGAIGGCYPWEVDDGAEVIDCDGVAHAAYTTHHFFGDAPCEGCLNYWQECFALAPYDLSPACGTTDVPLDVMLSWTESSPANKWVRITTDPSFTNPSVYTVSGNSFSPDFLERSTTYYWNVSVDLTGDVCDGGVSSVYSFTTEGVIAAKGRPWGAIKVLYR